MPKPAKTPVGAQPENPARLILDGAVAENEWNLLPLDADTEITAASLAPGKVILPLTVWLALRGDLQARKGEIGVWLDSDETADLIGDHASELPLIAAHFPLFTDGRAFTAGRLLRQRYGFTGELRAVGNFMRDQLTYLKRCGFNAFAYQGNQPLEGLLESLQDFTDSYQSAVDQPLPIYRRRALA
ncbi:DUF934 domain-containing protein [Microbulbifer harenosus]|uniref:DUF934 domain-containing protein n=1 Tax=Microbulbifer harenosus TaxID=2576840 RepID=A0ABY2UIU8_9GAMM|nr:MULTISPECIES: DUF934 domain-containing protein [Microbulbifer]QIL89049.1 DUF934 domain-containing protein [Microbulbifer sp. SH-1]TLM77783.1 DUF934 domain-containing protein [Microbulbifer harenosus]